MIKKGFYRFTSGCFKASSSSAALSFKLLRLSHWVHRTQNLLGKVPRMLWSKVKGEIIEIHDSPSAKVVKRSHYNLLKDITVCIVKNLSNRKLSAGAVRFSLTACILTCRLTHPFTCLLSLSFPA